MSNAELHQRKAGGRAKWKDGFCTFLTLCVLFLIALLAIPACLIVWLIEAVWELADKVIRAIE